MPSRFICIFYCFSPVNSYVSVTGLSGVFSSGGLYYPIVRLRAAGDVVEVVP